MKVSIIIPVYNSEQYLQKCLESIRVQTFKDYEVILVNDGSTDNSEMICRQFINADSRFHLYCQSNLGASVARNKGIKLSKGEYIIFIDSDDWVENDYIQKLISVQERNPTDLIIWGFVIGKPNNSKEYHLGSCFCYGVEECACKIFELKQKHKYGFTVQFLYKKSIIDEYKIYYPENIKLHEDMIFANYYCRYINSLQVIDFLGYHYVDYGTVSLSDHFLYSDQCFQIANTMYDSASHWKDFSSLYLFETKQYIGYLSMSIVNMYMEKKIRRRTQRIERIRFVKSEIKKAPDEATDILPSVRRFVLRKMPVFVIDILYFINRLRK